MSQDCESNDAKVIIEYNEKKEKNLKKEVFQQSNIVELVLIP